MRADVRHCFAAPTASALDILRVRVVADLLADELNWLDVGPTNAGQEAKFKKH